MPHTGQSSAGPDGHPNFLGVATDPGEQSAPRRPPTQRPTTPSLFEPHRPFIEAQLRLKCNATAMYQGLLALYAAPAEVIWLGP